MRLRAARGKGGGTPLCGCGASEVDGGGLARDLQRQVGRGADVSGL